MKKIKLTQGKYALIDEEDFDLISQYKWYAKKIGNTFYAARAITVQGQNKHKNIKRKQKTIIMHREIMKNKLKQNQEIDHINGNGLDNRKCNLRLCNRSENMMNQRIKKGTSQYKGVRWDKKWRAQITYNKKQKHLGFFNNEIDAAKAYDKKAKELFGEFAKLNFNEVEYD